MLKEVVIIKVFKRHKVITSIVSVILIILIILAGYGYWLYHNVSSSFQPTNNKQSSEVKKNIKDRKPFSLYISGNGEKQSDSSSNDKDNQGNNKSNSFLSSIKINPKNNTTTITKMNPGQQENNTQNNQSSDNKMTDKNNDNDQKTNKAKDNHNEQSSSNKDGENIKNAQQNLGIPADASYIDINGAKNIVNQSNGLTITPTQTFNSNGQQFTAGKTVTLNGDQALAYAKGGGSNQHQLLSSFVSKNSDIKSFLSPSMVKEISSYTKTNLSPDDISQLYQHYRGALQNIQYK